MSSAAEIETAIIGYVSSELGLPAEEIGTASSLRELPGVESVKVLRVVARIERDFDIELDDELVFRLETVDELTRAVCALVGGEASS